MPKARRFIQCDVFTPYPTKGNALAVVLDCDGLSDEAMQSFARWTNLAETTFLFPPDTDQGDYRVRILTPSREMPFAGHPTLNSALAHWRLQNSELDKAIVVAQDTNIDRHGRVYVTPNPSITGQVSIGGQTHILVEGTVVL